MYAVTDEGDAPMPRMITDGCLFTSCPIQKSTKQTYTYGLYLDKKFPKVRTILNGLFLSSFYFYVKFKFFFYFIEFIIGFLFEHFFFFQGTYTIRWVLRDATKDDETTERCCFTTRIKLIK